MDGILSPLSGRPAPSPLFGGPGRNQSASVFALEGQAAQLALSVHISEPAGELSRRVSSQAEQLPSSIPALSYSIGQLLSCCRRPIRKRPNISCTSWITS